MADVMLYDPEESGHLMTYEEWEVKYGEPWPGMSKSGFTRIYLDPIRKRLNGEGSR